jgi:hypothetical protein
MALLVGNVDAKTKKAFGAMAWNMSMPVCRSSVPTFTRCDPFVHERLSCTSSVDCVELRGPVIAPPIGV